MIRKGRTRGRVTQRMMSFRLDVDNVLWLDAFPNKGRYINWLIKLDRKNDMSIKLNYNETMEIKRHESL